MLQRREAGSFCNWWEAAQGNATMGPAAQQAWKGGNPQEIPGLHPWAGHRQEVHTTEQPCPPLQAAEKNKERGNYRITKAEKDILAPWVQPWTQHSQSHHATL